VEGLHSIRRKFADKRLNFKASYACRANMALLSAYIENWMKLILEKLNVPVSSYMEAFFEVNM